jgi:hypothetical protein
MVKREHWGGGTALTAKVPDGDRSAIVRDKFWI